MKLLHIDSSILGGDSVSRTLSAEIVARWRAAVPGIEVSYLDLAANPLPHLSGGTRARSNEIEAARDARVLEDFLAADVIVIGAPMYNFTISSQLKAWLDRILVAGKTFRYTDSGPVGLAGGKQVIVALARGGVYPDGAPGEHVESYLRFIFGFVGITDVSWVRADGLAISPEHRARGIEAARAAIPTPLRKAA